MDKKYTSLEHSIRNIVNESIGGPNTDKYKGTPKPFLQPAPHIEPKVGDSHPDGSSVAAKRGTAKIQQSETMKEEEQLDEAELEEDWKKTAKQAATDVADFGAAAPYAWVGGQKARSYMTGLKDTATMGMGDTVRAGMDYLAKNAAHQVGLGKGTTWETETKQQEEKKKKAQEAEPGAYKAGEITGVVGPVATGVGGVVTAGKLATGLAKGAYNLAKNPSTLKKLSTYKPLVTPQNPFAAAKDVASIGVAIEGGKTGYKAATDKDFRDYIKDKTSKPGGTGDLVKDITKPAIDLAAPGATDAAQGKDVGRNLSRTVGGLAADVFLPTMAYDIGSQLLGGQGISGKDGWAPYLYDKMNKKKKESTTQKPIGESKKDIIKKVIKEGRAEAVKDLKTLKLAPDVLKDFEAWKAAKEAEEAAKSAPKPKKAPPQTEPGREGAPIRRDNDNVPPRRDDKVVPIRRTEPGEWPAPYKPGKDIPNMPPPANPSPGAPKVPEFKPPPDMPPPANPKKVEPKEPAAPVKKPEPGIPDKGRPAPTTNPVETKPKVTPTEVPALPVDPRINPKFIPGNRPAPAAEPAKTPAAAPTKAPDSLPNPAADPLRRPISQPLAEPVPAAQPAPAQKAADNAVVAKPQPEKKPEKKEETKKREETKKTEEKPPKRRGIVIPSIPGVNPDVTSGLMGNVNTKQYLHRAGEWVSFGEASDSDAIRRTIENVARPGGKTRIARQAEIKVKIIDENNKRMSVIKRVIDDKKSTVNLHPKLKNPEVDQN